MTFTPDVHVTDHAVLRYLERSQGIDVELLRAHIGQLVHKGVRHGALSVKVDGVRFILDGTVVVTVFDQRWMPDPDRNKAEKER